MTAEICFAFGLWWKLRLRVKNSKVIHDLYLTTTQDLCVQLPWEPWLQICLLLVGRSRLQLHRSPTTSQDPLPLHSIQEVSQMSNAADVSAFWHYINKEVRIYNACSFVSILITMSIYIWDKLTGEWDFLKCTNYSFNSRSPETQFRHQHGHSDVRT